jgi:hypothetical protein
MASTKAETGGMRSEDFSGRCPTARIPTCADTIAQLLEVVGDGFATGDRAPPPQAACWSPTTTIRWGLTRRPNEKRSG